MNIDSIVKTRTLPISFTIEFDNGKSKKIDLKLKSMKVKTIRKLAALRQTDDESSIREMIKLILNNNTSNFKIKDELIDELTFEQMQAIGQTYTDWLKINQKN